MNDPHSSLIKTPQQLIVVVVAAFVVPIVVILLIAALVTSGRRSPSEADESALLARIQPIGTVELAPGPSALAAAAPGTATPGAGTAGGAAAGQAPAVAVNMPPPAAPAAGTAKADGRKVYESACAACHTAGVAGAPKIGDKANWPARIAQGTDMLYVHAIKGFQGKAGVMPPKGGNLALSDAEVKAAVDYMLSTVK